MQKSCASCQAKAKEWNEKCDNCGFSIILEPEEKIKAKYLRTPSLGALFFTQGWSLGARLYLPFLLSLIPIVGIPNMVVCILFGRRLSWKYGGWSDWQEFVKWMRLLDILAIIWIVVLIITFFLFKK